MKKIFSTKDKKLTDKTFSQSMLISIISILLCVVALCSVTYAWFTTNVSSGENVIESSRFALDITVYDENDATIDVIDNADETYRCTFESVGVYTVVLKMSDDTTASKGYCEITINSTEKKQTTPISKDTTIGVDPFTFKIEITEANTVIVFKPKWGMSASADIANDGLLVTDEVTDNDDRR